MNYNNVSCPVCGKPFTENDDIVVCPECGAPHHRDCYKELGHCALESELHEQGLSWKNPNEKEDVQKAAPQQSDNGGIICPNCGLNCAPTDNFCPNCNTPLHPADNNNRPVVENAFDASGNPEVDNMFGAIYENDNIDGIPAKDFICITRQNFPYFLRVFKIFSQRAKAKVFNWSAFFFNYFYFFYRKMYKLGAFLLAFYLISNIPSFILSYHMVEQIIADPMLAASMQFDLTGLDTVRILSQLFMYIRFAVSIYCGFTANRHYYKHCREKISKLQSVSHGGTKNEYYQTLTSIGGTSLVSCVIVMIGMAVLTFGIAQIFALMLL